MSNTPHVLAITASLRKESVNHLLLLEAVDILKSLGIQPKELWMRDEILPLYHPDDEKEKGTPLAAQHFRDALIASDWVLIATPEHNASMPASLKNAIDWASRENAELSRTAFEGKKWVLMSASPSGRGGANSLKHLRDSITILRGEALSEEFSLPNAYNAFDEKGKLKDPETRKALRQFLEKAFAPLFSKKG